MLRLRPSLASAILAGACALLPGGAQAATSTDALATWGDEPVVALSATRGEVVLNGLWRFMPAAGPAAAAPTGDWGWIRVPGSWETRRDWAMFHLEGLVAEGGGPAWEGAEVQLKDPNASNRTGRNVTGVDRAWYEREFSIPGAWNGRAVLLRFERVSTDARVYVDDKLVGRLRWPGGTVDITGAVRPGSTHRLRLYVAAVPDPREVEQWMDSEYVIRRPAEIDTRGITGDVVLQSRPAGASIQSLFAQPSAAERSLRLAVDFGRGWAHSAHTLEVVARTWPHGTEARRWVRTATPASDSPATLDLEWPDVRLWDIGSPTLYTLEVTARAGEAGAPIVDSLPVRFGFRDISISGRDFLLNGKVLRMRPALFGESANAGTIPLIRAEFQRRLAEGVNVVEIWPNDDARRGRPSYRPLIASIADEVGIGLLMPAVSVEAFWGDPAKADVPPADRDAWREAARERMVEVRNSPSILAHLFHGNRFLTYDDQNPRRIGQRTRLAPSAKWEAEADVARALMEQLRAMDPTRPITSHANSNVGDFHTSNNYLGLLPLQEREDWLSEWAASGDMPYMAVEFASPFSGDMNRSRRGWDSGSSEQLLTEHAAAELGARAYDLEDEPYRASIASAHQGDQRYLGRLQGEHPLFLETATRSTRWLWRSWRTWGVSGGMIAWEGGYAFHPRRSANTRQDLTWTPGTRGTHLEFTTLGRLDTSGEHRDITVNGVEYLAGIAPVLAYIAGPEHNWTAKDHNFISGTRIEKTVVLVNDGRTDTEFTVDVESSLTGPVPGSPFVGTLPVGEIRRIPFAVPAPLVTMRTPGELRMRARLGGRELQDTFALTLYPEPAPAPTARVHLLDPRGDSAKTLRDAGVQFRLIDGIPAIEALDPAKDRLLIGRNALTDTPKATGVLGEFVAKGGRAVLFAQDPDWLRGSAGVRVHRWLGRRFWAVETQGSHPLVIYQPADAFQDWRGSGSLVEPTAHTALGTDPRIYPTYGWRWGSRGSVSSAAWEKPHKSGWTPVLEGEFDLAYSPLLELRHGAGLLVYCGLDLEARGALEPVAWETLVRLIARLESAPAAPRRDVYFAGGPEGARILEATGVAVTANVTSPPQNPTASILVLGDNHGIPEGALREWVSRSGRVLVLGSVSGAVLGFRSSNATFASSSEVPDWPEAAGLGRSDLRYRVDTQVPLLIDAPTGGEIASDGLLGRLLLGNGSVVIAQLDPMSLGEDQKTYLRFTRWRLTRALSQILANLGASFPADQAFFDLKTDAFAPIDLTGAWRAKEELRLPPAPSPWEPNKDPGGEGLSAGWQQRGFDDSSWTPLSLPAMLNDDSVVDWEQHNGSVWFRKSFEIPADWKGRGDLVLHLGTLDDHDVTFVNGSRVGAIGASKQDAWNTERVYKVQAFLIKPGETNTIAVRLFNQYGGGGFGAPKSKFSLRIELAKPVDAGGLYVPGYRHDRDFGDDPARYVRW